MNSDELNRETAHEQMMEETIKKELEKNGTMAAIRSEMHLKILQLLRGEQDMLKPNLLTGEATKSNKTPRDQSLIKLINQLIMEFFNWFGYRHTLETFRMETGDDVAIRSELEERLFIIPDSKDLPLLAQLVMRDWKSSLPQKVQRPVSQNSKPKEKVKVLPSPMDVKVKKLIQNNQKLIASDPMRKVITIKHSESKPSQPRPITKKANRKVSMESSESDILETDYSEESEDSDAYADIPDRHVFEDDLLPEGKYISGQGEEGELYDPKGFFQQYQEGLPTVNIPNSSKKPVTPKKKKCEKIETNGFKGFELGNKSSGSVKLKKASKTRPPTLADEPETHIRGIEFDSEESCDDDASL
ncbi:uncharacterized protein [Drosophila kikkawai]|uniref:LisH domain-containing protein n=1 Tax=Drosophila kikkawai TaxID=30033 RepID=A0A6P4IQX3_DROKI|nr:uncharacterized protein LOC108080951 [Drosophila kikkawai]